MNPITLISALIVRYYCNLPDDVLHLWHTHLDWAGRISGIVCDTPFSPNIAVWLAECAFAGVLRIAKVEYTVKPRDGRTRVWVWFDYE